jgi:hypothetical protein
MLSRLCFLIAQAAVLSAATPFWVQVLDQETQLAVPLVELRTLNELAFYTDSNGIAVIDTPELDGQRVFFNIRAHGYEFTEKVMDDPGKIIEVKPGSHLELKMVRRNVAERVARLTGAGIYRDSSIIGFPIPLEHPLMNGLVVGQDTTIAAPYQGKLFWCWGDTFGPAAMNFKVSCATSELPSKGGLHPDRGVDYHYFTDTSGFTRQMLPLKERGLVWLEGLFTVAGPDNRERLVATYTRQNGLRPPDERGVAVFDDKSGVFQPLAQFPSRRSHWSSHPIRVTENGVRYWYLYPNQRVRDDWRAIQDFKNYESFTCLETGMEFDPKSPRLASPCSWRAGTEFLSARQERELINRKLLKPEDALFPLLDSATGSPTNASASSLSWNENRKRYILLSEQTGNVYYSEAPSPLGPWRTAVKIVSHDDYNFYNVVHHPFFDDDRSGVIYFEGTYTDAFSRAKTKTPRYNYNQILYRLRLDRIPK